MEALKKSLDAVSTTKKKPAKAAVKGARRGTKAEAGLNFRVQTSDFRFTAC